MTTDVNSIICPVCGDEFFPKAMISAKGILALHMRVHTDNPKKRRKAAAKKRYEALPIVATYTCPVCGKEFYDKGPYKLGVRCLATHIKYGHKGFSAGTFDAAKGEQVIRTRVPVVVGINGKMVSGVEITVKNIQYRDVENMLKLRYGNDIIVDRYDKTQPS